MLIFAVLFPNIRAEKIVMSILSSIPLFSIGGSILGTSASLLATAAIFAGWALILLVLHPLHASLFILAALFEYGLITWFGFHLWFNFFSFFICYIILFVLYTLFLRKLIPLPQSDIEHLIKLSELKQQNLLTDEEYTAAKKRLLKIRR
jgi:Ca2+/Na+ antiporter